MVNVNVPDTEHLGMGIFLSPPKNVFQKTKFNQEPFLKRALKIKNANKKIGNPPPKTIESYMFLLFSIFLGCFLCPGTFSPRSLHPFEVISNRLVGLDSALFV